jgi:hypothetical protein
MPTDDPEITLYHVRATDPATHKVVAYECRGFEAAHAKAAELRMAAYKDVVLSLSEPDSSPRPG